MRRIREPIADSALQVKCGPGRSTGMQIIRYWVLICLRLMAGQLWMMLRTGWISGG